MSSVGRMRRGLGSVVEGEQELLPGILDHITIENIVPKLKWETCNALQMVSREWQRAIHNRSVFDARVRSQSTNAFLVLACLVWDGTSEPVREVVLTLYSCKDGSFFRIPSVPLETNHRADSCFNFDCICLDGRLYLWVTTNRSYDCPSVLSWSCPDCGDVAAQVTTEICMSMGLWTLDLAGDKQWRILEPENCAPLEYELSYSALGGKLYRFRNAIRSHHQLTPPGATGSIDTNWNKMSNCIKIECYNPLSNTWLLITPEPMAAKNNSATSDNSFSHCEREELREQTPSLEINPLYEPFYSEWKRQQSIAIFTTHNDHSHGNVMANQSYRRCRIWVGNGIQHQHMENLLFMGGKLARLIQHERHLDYTAVIQTYDPRRSTWSDSESYRMPSHDQRDISNTATRLRICDCASTGDAIWAIVIKGPRGPKSSLMKSPLKPGSKVDSNVDHEWIDTTFSTDDYSYGRFLIKSMLRPIYI